MGLENVKREILEKARKEAAEITSAAQAEAKAIMRAAEKQMQNYEQLIDEDVDRSVEQMRRRELASAELELQKQVLAAKNELIEDVFSQATRKLGQLGDKRREAHVKALLDLVRKEMNVAVVQCNSRDARFLEGSTGNDGSGGKLKVIKNDSISGGIVAESPDRKLKVDYGYESVLGQTKSKVLSDVARLLFGK
ncbi:hypothetical protein HYV85_05420 [Candidatus Woesearchaeota archaeon]|nr:hypothetical protein [Candidatus Woesearchaeota archaeon]